MLIAPITSASTGTPLHPGYGTTPFRAYARLVYHDRHIAVASRFCPPTANQGGTCSRRDRVDRCARAVGAVDDTDRHERAFADTKYPDWSRQWHRDRIWPASRGGQPPFDPTKPVVAAKAAPLTPEYQAVFERNAQGSGARRAGHLAGRPLPAGRNAGDDDVVSAHGDRYHAAADHLHPDRPHPRLARRIFTDGRDLPEDVEPTFDGYSLGKWIDEDGNGRYNVLEIETRHLRGSRAVDPSGIALHEDGKMIVKERLFLDKTDPHLLHNQMTVIDSALTRPWTVNKRYRRMQEAATALARGCLHRWPGADPHRRGAVFPQRRRPPDAGQKGPGTAGHALFRTADAVKRPPQCVGRVSVTATQVAGAGICALSRLRGRGLTQTFNNA